MKYNIEQLNEIFDKFEVKNGADFWKMLIIEHLLCDETCDLEDFTIEEEALNDMAETIMEDDGLWQEIDYTIQNIISDYITKGEK